MTEPLATREPAVVITSVLGAVIAAAGFLTAWGNGADWRGALGGALVAGATAVGAGFGIRSQVTPEPNVTARVDAAVSSVYREVNDDIAGA